MLDIIQKAADRAKKTKTFTFQIFEFHFRSRVIDKNKQKPHLTTGLASYSASHAECEGFESTSGQFFFLQLSMQRSTSSEVSIN